MISERAETLTLDFVRQLARHRGQPVVMSFYLDVDGRNFPRPSDLDPKIEHLFRAAREQGGRRGADVLHAVEEDLDGIRARLAEGIDRDRVRGFAAFSWRAGGLSSTIEVPVGFRDSVSIDRYPHVAQLLHALGSLKPSLVVLADKERSRLFRLEAGRVTEHEGPVEEAARQVDTDTELGSFERRDAEATRRHLRRVAMAVVEETRREKVDHIVLGGPSADQLTTFLSQHDACCVAGTITTAITASAEQVVIAASARVADAERERQAQLVEELRSRVGIGTTLGLQATIDSLAERRVSVLVLSWALEASGVRCASCGLLAADGERCRRCDAPTEAVADLVEAALVAALADGSAIEFVDSSTLDASGGIGAIERY